MINKFAIAIFGWAATSACAATLFVQPAQAGTLVGDWYYSPDSSNDSMAGSDVGGTKYEIHNMAMQQTSDEVIFAINSNLSLSGTGSQYAHDGHIAWGDLFLNFTGQSLDAANNAGDLLSIRFASNNESNAPTVGVYSDVTGTDTVRANGLLLDDLADYNNWIRSHGGNPSVGDLSATDPYFNQNRHIQNVIASGTRIGEVTMLDDLSNLELDFAQFGATGSNTFAFSVARELLPAGDFIAHLAMECDNDVIAMESELEEVPVPEPSTAIALGAVGLVLGASRKRRQGDDAS